MLTPCSLIFPSTNRRSAASNVEYQTHVAHSVIAGAFGLVSALRAAPFRRLVALPVAFDLFGGAVRE